jgi:hypothetical protein
MSRLPTILRDVSVIAGAACLVYGAWAAWRPLGFILGGMGLIAAAVLWELDERWKREEAERNRRGGM